MYGASLKISVSRYVRSPSHLLNVLFGVRRELARITRFPLRSSPFSSHPSMYTARSVFTPKVVPSRKPPVSPVHYVSERAVQ